MELSLKLFSLSHTNRYPELLIDAPAQTRDISTEANLNPPDPWVMDRPTHHYRLGFSRWRNKRLQDRPRPGLLAVGLENNIVALAW